MKDHRRSYLPSVPEAALVIAAVVGILASCNLGLSLPPQISLLLSTMLLCGFAAYLGHSWDAIEAMIRDGLRAGLVAMLINCMIGMLIAVLCASGTMPYLICLGFRVISPRFFLITAFLCCAFFSCCTGSSYTTAGTVGVALMGIAAAVEADPAVVCGAILGGSYFGEKLSPISEATNTASACAEAPLADHIKAMRYVIFPAAAVTAAIYLVMGLLPHRVSGGGTAAETLEQTFETLFRMNPLLIAPIVAMVVMILRGCPALKTLAAGIGTGCLVCVFLQGMTPQETAYTLLNGCAVDCADPVVSGMLERGGLNSMNGILTIMLFGLPMGGLLKGTGTLSVVIGRLGGAVKTVPKAVTASSLCSMAAAGMTGSNYPAYVLTVSAFSEVYDSLGLEHSVLSRSCEMAAFCGAVLPWTSTGAFMSSVLGVPAFAYAPYFFFGLLVPILTIVCSCSGWGIFYIEQGQKEEDRG